MNIPALSTRDPPAPAPDKPPPPAPPPPCRQPEPRLPEKQDARLIDFSREIKIDNPLLRGAWRMVSRPVENILGIPKVNDTYRNLLRQTADGAEFFPAALHALGFGYTVPGADLARIPRSGPLFVVSNHPSGAADGIILGAMLSQARPDLKLLANLLLMRMEGIRPWMIPVNPFGGAKAAGENRGAMRAALRHLGDGGCLATFPSGEVSHFQWNGCGVSDPAWKTHIARMVRGAGATVLPVFIHGRNSMLFQCLGMVSARARTALLAREMVAARGKQFHLRIGNPIPFAKLKNFESDEAMTEFLRLSAYALHDAAHTEPEDARLRLARLLSGSAMRPAPARARKQRQEPVIPPVPPVLVRSEIDTLPPEAKVAGNDTFSVYVFHGAQLPHTLREVGRLREVTFRAAAEGTGKACDLDKFDKHYDHLVLYDSKEGVVAGAYRLGRTDVILEKFGKRGLYTSTLFHFRPGFFMKLSPAIELGRSFIRAEYQRHPACMFMLWRGITAYMSRHPRYTTLFGPVSINPEYHAFSRRLIMEFSKKSRVAGELSEFVSARNPPRRANLRGVDIVRLLEASLDMNDLSTLVSGLERDSKPLPILLKHYLKLNGQLISFNVDPAFGECLDGLIVVDVLKIPQRTLKAYMGAEEAVRFLRYHRQNVAAL